MTEYLIIILWNLIIGLIFLLNIDKVVRKNWVPFSFFCGTSITLLLSFWMSYFGLPFYKINVFLVALAFATGFITAYYKRKLIVEYAKSFSKEDAIAFIVCVLIGMLPMMIRKIFNAEFPYIDGYTYISIADYLKEFGYSEIVELEEMKYHPWLSQMFLYQTNHLRIGAQMLLAFFTSLFGKRFALDVFSPLTGYNIFLCGMAIWNLVEIRFNKIKYNLIIGIVIIGGNIPIIYWCAIYGFLPQVMGMAFLLFSITQILDSIESKCRKQAIIDGLSIAALSLIYNEILPFFVLSIIGPLMFYLIKGKNAWKVVFNILLTAITTGLLILVYLINMIKAVINMLHASVGWEINKGLFDYIAYYISTIPADETFKSLQINNMAMGYVILTIIILMIVIIGINSLIKFDCNFIKLWILVTIPWVFALLYFMFLAPNTNMWSVFKLLQYYFIVGGPIIAYAIIAFIKEYIKKKNIVVICLIGFIGFNFYNAYWYSNKLSDNMRNYTGNIDNPVEEYYSLNEKYKNEEKPILLLGLPNKHRQMVTYVLKDNKLISDWLTDDYFGAMTTNMEIGEEEFLILMYEPQADNAIANLCEKEVGILFGEGFYDLESDAGRTWRWGKNTAKLSIYKNSNDKGTLFIDACGINEDPNGILEVCNSEGKVIKEYKLYADQTVNIELEIDTNTNCEEFILKYSGEPVMESENVNARSLAFLLQNWKYETTS